MTTKPIQNSGIENIIQKPILNISIHYRRTTMALYLKYRPKNFEELVKQEHITSILKPKVSSNDNAHSNYLFYGPRGTGKTSTARIFAKALNCTNLQDGNPCNVCENCQNINANKTIDVVEIDAASHTGVDNVREEIISKAPYPPAGLKKKVYIIDEVHMLSKPAFNALLKIMEEPPQYLVFILATTEIHKVPETIISRCQVFTFKKIPVVDLVNHLTMICQKEGLTYTDEALISIAKIADGCARDAVKYLDQVSILGSITQEHVTSFLGVASDQLMKSFLEAIITKDLQQAFSIADSLHDTGVDIHNFIKQCLVYIEEHFSENIEGYITCSDILKRILYGLKTFPLPIVLMKMEIYNTFNQSTASGSQEAKKKSNDITTPSSNIAPAPRVENTSPKVINHTTETPTEENSMLDKIAQYEGMPSNIASIIKKSCILDHGNDKSTLYIFNKLQGGILQKPDNWSIIERAFKQATNANHGLHIIITTKEEYVAMQL